MENDTATPQKRAQKRVRRVSHAPKKSRKQAFLFIFLGFLFGGMPILAMVLTTSPCTEYFSKKGIYTETSFPLDGIGSWLFHAPFIAIGAGIFFEGVRGLFRGRKMAPLKNPFLQDAGAPPADADKKPLSEALVSGLTCLVVMPIGLFFAGMGFCIFLSSGDTSLLETLAASTFFFIGCAIISFAFFLKKKPPVNAITARIMAPLPAEFSSGQMSIFLFGFSIFWNLIVGVFVAVIFEKYRENGTCDIFEICFVLVFALIGVIILCCAIYQGLTWFGGKFSIEMKPVISPGETVPLRWRFFGNLKNVAALKLHLGCTVQRRENYGKSSRTYAEVLEKIVLFQTNELTAGIGETMLALPRDAQVSSCPDRGFFLEFLNSGDGEIFWKIVAEVRRKRLPRQVWKFRVIVCAPEK